MKEYVQRPTEIEEKPERGTLSRLGRALVLGGAVIGAVASVNAFVASRAGTPRHELGGVFARYPWRFGDLAYTVAGKGTPLVLVHGLGAGNSMAEWSEVFPLLREHFTTYAFDFLGWGLSDQPDIEYVADDYVAQLVGFIEDVVGEPCIVAASGDGCDYAIRAAARMPNLISQIVLVCPPLVPERQATAPLTKAVETVFSWPVVGAALNNVLASQRSIDGFARHQLFYDKALSDPDFIKRHASRAHRKGSRQALATFLSGRARADAREEWSRLEQPALLVWGRNATLSSLETAPEWLALKPDAQLAVVEEAMMLPHYEHPRQWTNRVLDWLRQPSAQSTWPSEKIM